MQSLIVSLLSEFKSLAAEEVAQRSCDSAQCVQIQENDVLTMQAQKKKKWHYRGTVSQMGKISH